MSIVSQLRDIHKEMREKRWGKRFEITDDSGEVFALIAVDKMNKEIIFQKDNFVKYLVYDSSTLLTEFIYWHKEWIELPEEQKHIPLEWSL